ncbi:MAG TPA: tetratricopeptide repeat protein [Acidobacteriaceae bacterium]|jgi:tetratricopeptide (TPR) repeat protein|nr:tetratricopeptide repeat protein [Acidobacteriaceae bacterium]
MPKVRPRFLKIAVLPVLFFTLVCIARGQTYQVGPNGSAQPPKGTSQSASPGQSLGWGSNIQNARLARAAELALKQGHHAEAQALAQRATQTAPSDPHLWFLLGYAARLNKNYGLSIDSYNHGLRLQPGAVEGLSGLAQTDAVMGRTKDAEDLLQKIVTSNPKRVNDAVLLGELQLRSGDDTTALQTLGTAERMAPSARSEVLMAIAYQHMKQYDQAGHYLDLAKHRAPNNPDVERSLAGYYRQMGQYGDAIQELKAIAHPTPDIKAELAFTYQLNGNLDEAAKIYTDAANEVPKNLPLQLSAAQAEVAAGSDERANKFLERVASVDPDNYRLHAIRGQIDQNEDRPDEAVREYNAALAHLPAAPAEGVLYPIQMHMDLVSLYRGLDQDDAAQKQLALAETQIGALNDQGADRVPFLRLRATIRLAAGDVGGARSDIQTALSLSPNDPNNLQLSGDILMKLGQPEDAIATYKKVLAQNPSSRSALTSLGYASRVVGRDKDAEMYFERLAKADPRLYVPYLGLGDLYSSRHDYTRAENDYRKAYALSPHNASIVAGGMNAGIESHKLEMAGVWMQRATPAMQNNARLLREEERYLSFKGNYQESARIGEKAIGLLPRDRDVVVYLGYDYLHLDRYQALLQLTQKYNSILTKEPDIPLLAGYVEKHDNHLNEARADFTEAIERDPNTTTAYVNRGYILHDLHQPRAAENDFETAVRQDPKNSEAHMGLAYTSLDLHKPQKALREVNLAVVGQPDALPVHLIRATAYGQEGALVKSANEYRAAIKFDPNDGELHMALASTLYSLRHYHQAIDELQVARRLSPADPLIYAWLARSWAEVGNRDETLRYVELAENRAQMKPATDVQSGDEAKLHFSTSDVYVFTGDALAEVGDQRAAMLRFRRALVMPDSDRVEVRLAVAELMARQGHASEASRQIALALMEAEAGTTLPPTGQQLIEAADVFRRLHDYQLSETYLQRAQAAGASDTAVHIGLANTYLALGDTARAQGELDLIRKSADEEPNYQYLLAEASVYRQEHQNAQALTAFAQAVNAAGEDQTAEQNLLQAGGDEGYRVNSRLSALDSVTIQPIFEDTPVYVLDSKLDALFAVPPTDTALLPPPRSSIDTEWTNAFHLHLNYLPTATGFFLLRNARGTISVPSTNSIVNRNTTDYSFNIGLNPTVHLGSNVITFNSGIQETLRRDALEPRALNQNILREFTYMSTSSFFHLISANGYVLHEAGPFTEINERSHAFAAALNFQVGAPWSRTALITGWGENDQNFDPVGIEDYYSSSYVGLQHQFGSTFNLKGIVEDLRAWRVVAPRSAISQALVPSTVISWSPARNWQIQANAAWSSTRGFHIYDDVTGGATASWALPFHRTFHDETGDVLLQYPIRFTGGIQQEKFYNFTGAQNQQFRPFVGITIF